MTNSNNDYSSEWPLLASIMMLSGIAFLILIAIIRISVEPTKATLSQHQAAVIAAIGKRLDQTDQRITGLCEVVKAAEDSRVDHSGEITEMIEQKADAILKAIAERSIAEMNLVPDPVPSPLPPAPKPCEPVRGAP